MLKDTLTDCLASSVFGCARVYLKEQVECCDWQTAQIQGLSTSKRDFVTNVTFLVCDICDICDKYGLLIRVIRLGL